MEGYKLFVALYIQTLYLFPHEFMGEMFIYWPFSWDGVDVFLLVKVKLFYSDISIQI